MKLNTRKKRITKVALAAAMCLAMLLSSFTSFTAKAADREVVDLDRIGSISVTFTYYNETDGKTYPVTNGNTVGLYKVAYAEMTEVGPKFFPTDKFKMIGEIPSTTDELNKVNVDLAEQCAVIAYPMEYDVKPVSLDANGTAVFKDLEVGVYLVLQDKQGAEIEDRYVIAPFLMTVPMRNPDGSLTYDVVADSKPIGVGKEEVPPPPPPTPHRVPQTGQLWWPVMVFGAMGVLLMCVGLVRKTKKN